MGVTGMGEYGMGVSHWYGGIRHGSHWYGIIRHGHESPVWDNTAWA